MKTDLQIQKDVIEELRWEPSLEAESIGVSVRNGIVTLNGIVDSYPKKLAAEKCAKKIEGVKAVAEDIQVGISPASRKTDSEIAEAIVNALKWHSGIDEKKITIKVENGHVRLDGEAEWEYERRQVQTAIENLEGIRSVLNMIRVKPKLSSADIHEQISLALVRTANIDSENIRVETKGGKVILTGKVRSISEKEDAESAVWSAPGVVTVENNLEVGGKAFAFDM